MFYIPIKQKFLWIKETVTRYAKAITASFPWKK